MSADIAEEDRSTPGHTLEVLSVLVNLHDAQERGCMPLKNIYTTAVQYLRDRLIFFFPFFSVGPTNTQTLPLQTAGPQRNTSLTKDKMRIEHNVHIWQKSANRERHLGRAEKPTQDYASVLVRRYTGIAYPTTHHIVELTDETRSVAAFLSPACVSSRYTTRRRFRFSRRHRALYFYSKFSLANDQFTSFHHASVHRTERKNRLGEREEVCKIKHLTPLSGGNR